MKKSILILEITSALCLVTSYMKADNVLTSSTTQTVSGQTYTSTTADQSAVKVTAGTLSITKCKLYNSGNASSTDNASFYGTNAVMLAYGSSTSPVINSSYNYVAGSGTGSNGIFAYGKGVVKTSYDKIYQTGVNSRAIMASGGGTVTVIGDTATTVNGSSSVIATDRGSGTINVTGGIYTANGSNSAGLYSTGVISATDATFISNGGEIYVIEGSNSINVTNCKGTSNKNKWGILMYQSFSGDAEGSTGTFTATGGSLDYEGTCGGLFYNTNATAKIYLNGVTITNKCDTLVRSLKGGGGNNATASSGGTAYIYATDQTMSGMIYADANSKDYITLSGSTAYTNAKINPGNVASLVTLTMDATSTLSLASDCYINGAISISGLTSGSIVSNISGNGHSIYYTKSTNSGLNGATYSLTNGGYLLPLGTNGISSIEDATESVTTVYTLNGVITSSDNLTPGIYIVRTVNGNVVTTKKIIVK